MNFYKAIIALWIVWKIAQCKFEKTIWTFKWKSFWDPDISKNIYLPQLFQMEDDVEVELELEKQLALAHELFPTGWPKAGLPPNWWQLAKDSQTKDNDDINTSQGGETKPETRDKSHYLQVSAHTGPGPAHI